VKKAEKSANDVGAEMRGVVERSEDMRKLTDLQSQRSKSLIEIATASASRATQTVAGATEVVGITDELRQLSVEPDPTDCPVPDRRGKGHIKLANSGAVAL
jgi:methyl-accepting chemotaxis protein